MAFSFPSNPTVGQQVIGPNGFTYQFDGKGWVTLGGGGIDEAPENGAVYGRKDASWSAISGRPVTTGPSAPSPAESGDLWFNTDTNTLMVYAAPNWVAASDADVGGFLPLKGGAVTGRTTFVGQPNAMSVYGQAVFTGASVFNTVAVANWLDMQSGGIFYSGLATSQGAPSSAFGFVHSGGNYYLMVDATNRGLIQLTPSDAAMKGNVRPAEGDPLKAINGVVLKSFDWLKEYGGGHVPVGYVAQQVKEVIPQAVTGDGDKLPLGVDLRQMVAQLIGAVQQLTKRVAELEVAQ